MSTELDNTVIDGLRARILSDVDTDVASRGRTLRRRIAGSVGALALVVIAGVAGPSLLGGGAPSGMPEVYRDGDSTGMAPAPAPMPGTADSVMAEKAAPDAAPTDDREIITTGGATVRVNDPAVAADRFVAWIAAHHGRVDGRSEHRDANGNASASVTVRLPAKSVDRAIAQLRTYGVVDDVSLDHSDVTAQGRDLDARIKALKISVGRLEDILARGATTNQVIAAETALSERQQELEALESERRSLSEQVSLSTISVSFVEKNHTSSVAPDGFLGGLVRGWNALIHAVNALVTMAGAIVPWLGVAAAGWFGWRLVRRLRRHS